MKEILIVPVGDDIEFKVLKSKNFYRLPAEKGYSNPSDFSYLAVYRARPHKCIDHVARIRKVRIVQGRELDFGKHRAQYQRYKKGGPNYERNFYKIECGTLIKLAKPVANITGQPFRSPRITTFEKLLSASSLEDLRTKAS